MALFGAEVDLGGSSSVVIEIPLFGEFEPHRVPLRKSDNDRFPRLSPTLSRGPATEAIVQQRGTTPSWV